VSALDIVPTCLEAAGIQPADTLELDGASLLQPVEHNQETTVAKQPLFFKFDKHYAVIDDGWKLVFTENYNPADRPITSQIKLGKNENQLALYHVQNDPGEEHNLINEAPEKAQQLKQLFAGWLATMAADYKHYHQNKP